MAPVHSIELRPATSHSPPTSGDVTRNQRPSEPGTPADARDAAIRERMVTDPDQADPSLLVWARTQGRALLEASS